jgi:Na+/H+ antiporter
LVSIFWFVLACLILIGAGIANKTPFPNAVIWVLLGLGCAFIPGFPHVRLNPELALFLVLPPLVYSSAVDLPWPEFRDNLRPISLLAIGLVAATTGAVALVAHHIAGLPWSVSFALGAVISPTDPVAASAVASRVGLPHRLVAILEGEGLVNDAVSLSIFRIALLAWAGSGFSLEQGLLRLALILIGEPLYGWLLGIVVAFIRSRITDPDIEITVSLLTPFAAYLVPERLGGSGILATVAVGMYIGERSPELIPAGTRLHATSFWRMIVFLLNGGLFLTAGLELGREIGSPMAQADVLEWGLWIGIVIAGVRVLWCALSWFGFDALRAALRRTRRGASTRHVAVIAWSGMRGPISLAAALSIPAALGTAAGRNFQIVLAITAAVIVITLLGQGTVLPFLVRKLDLSKDADAEDEQLRTQERLGETEAARAALERLSELESHGRVPPETAEHLRRVYHDRVNEAESQAGTDGQVPGSVRSELIKAERARILELRREGRISDAGDDAGVTAEVSEPRPQGTVQQLSPGRLLTRAAQ